MPAARSVATTTHDPVQAAAAIASAATTQTRAVLVNCVVDVDAPRLAKELASALPGITIAGTTVCQRAATEAGADFTAAALVLDGALRVGAAVGDDADAAHLGKKLAKEALEQAGLKSASAHFAVLHATPGIESPLLRGLGEVLGPQLPIIGGSAADNDLTGKWHVFAGAKASSQGAMLLVCEWPGVVGVTYQSGYNATASKGVVTRASGRTIHEIDGRPAAEVYHAWTGLSLPVGTNVLGLTTLKPLGVVRGTDAGLDLHVLVHPERLLADGSIATFAEVESGETIVLLESSKYSLARRGATVARYAANVAKLKSDALVATFIVYCAGCSLALGDDVRAMVANTANEMRVPFLMPFTFGEQGRLTRGRPEHGNLMCSALVLGR